MRGRVAALLFLAAALAGEPSSAEPVREPVRLVPVPFSDLPGWGDDDHAAALSAFARPCRDGGDRAAGVSREARLAALCAEAAGLSASDARRFFETRFEALRVETASGVGLLTGYFEPVLDGSLLPDPAFPAALLARPDGMVLRPSGDAGPFPDGVSTARRIGDRLEPWPPRAAIEAGALGGAARPVVFLRDATDAFAVHVQGSATVRLRDGRNVRVGFDGRNGHPYTAVGRVLAERLGRPPGEMTADFVYDWLRANPGEASSVTDRNASFIFFRLVDRDGSDGPTGAAGWPLSAGRSVAIDPGHWPYGLPVWLDAAAAGDGTPALRRLTVAADTGSAIVGPARADLFVGSGPEAGLEAGRLRRRLSVTVLWPIGLPVP